MTSLHSDQQNEGLNGAKLQRIQVIAPHHPLCGQWFKIRQHLHRADGEYELVIELPDGCTQLIPACWTDLAPVAPLSTLAATPLFDSTSLRALVKMVASLTHQLQSEADHELNRTVPSVDELQYREPSTTGPSVGRSAVPAPASRTVAPDRRLG